MVQKCIHMENDNSIQMSNNIYNTHFKNIIIVQQKYRPLICVSAPIHIVYHNHLNIYFFFLTEGMSTLKYKSIFYLCFKSQ